MQLHLQTPYLAGVATAFVFSLVWLCVCVRYRWLVAARYWLGGCVLIAAGGSLLVAKAFTGEVVHTHLGMLVIMAGLGCFWQGARVFAKRRPLWFPLVFAIALSGLLLFLSGPTYGLHNLVYACGHVFVLVLILKTVMKASPRALGTMVTGSSMIVLASSYTVLFGLNLARVFGQLSEQNYAFFSPWFLALIVLLLGTVSFGFSLMITDGLRARLALLATRDELTGLHNRRGLRDFARLCEASARRRKAQVSIMIIDLDGFKSVNDHHGHTAGDLCLTHVVSLSERVLRRSDVMARLGGDEFCVLLPDTSLDKAAQIADRLANLIAESPAWHGGTFIPLAASIGLNCWTPEEEISLFDTFEEADRAMYKAKASGHDVCMAPGSDPVAAPLLAQAS